MRTPSVLYDELFKRAEDDTGITGRPAFVREALKALLQREASKRVALLGGSEPGGSDPDASAAPLRQSVSE